MCTGGMKEGAACLVIACLAVPVQAAAGDVRPQPQSEPEVDWALQIEGAPLIMTGFVDVRGGVRTQNDPEEDTATLAETRVQLEFFRDLDDRAYKLVVDLLADPLQEQQQVNLERGKGVLDLREASYIATLSDSVDIKAGRQILTWGTGDLIFINDMFPKDWQSFFIGRDIEYLKAPSDALKLSFFSPLVNLDVAYTPRFDTDRFIDGDRISFFNQSRGKRTGDSDVLKKTIPDDWLGDDEVAVRAYRLLGSYEVALYAYDGYWKSPAGFDPKAGDAIFPELTVFGASIRGNVAGGLGNLEIGDYRSRDNSDGKNPFIRNGEYRVLAGYEREVAHELTGGIQYYLEYMKDHDNYRDNLPPGVPEADEDRHVVTVRLTQLLMHQNLELSMFAFHSPSDNDGYLRPRARYKLDDSWLLEAGANVFYGDKDYTFFGQFEKNTNVYAAMRYGF